MIWPVAVGHGEDWWYLLFRWLSVSDILMKGDQFVDSGRKGLQINSDLLAEFHRCHSKTFP